MPVSDALSIDSLFWRKLARWGASRGPDWFVRYSPPVIGCVAAALVPPARRAVIDNLRRVRGPASPVRDAIDVGRTFASYASCLAEALSFGDKRNELPRAVVFGEHHMIAATKRGRGVVAATAHTGGWEAVGPLLARDHGVDIMMVMEPERDSEARRIHDATREARGHTVQHVGNDPFASLPLLRQLRAGGLVAMQIDRTPPAMRARAVQMFGKPAAIPEGALKLAQLTGAPIVPVFAARTGYREYVIKAFPEIIVARGASEAELDAAAQTMADAMTSFVRERPTQWFHFHNE